MANAQVENMKALAIRHGEKAVVGITAAVCVLCLFWAVTKPTIQITPDEVNKDADAARSSLERRQEPPEILASLEEQGIKNPGFAMLVKEQEKNAPKPAEYAVVRSWVTPEPGAGLIRDTPKLLAPTDLYAYPGRGGAKVYEIVDGKKVPEDPAAKSEEDAATKSRRSKKRGRTRGSEMAMMMMSMNSSMTSSGAANPAEMTEEQKKQLAIEEEKRKRLFAGTAGPDEVKTPEPTAPDGPYKEITKGLRWVAITGVLDHKTLRDNYLAALKNPAVAHPHYKQLDVQRQVKQSDGEWTDWEDVDAEKNHEISYNVPEEEEELTPETARINVLVDPLPFLTAGYWERVHVASLVPKEKREIDKAAVAGSMMPGMMGGSGSMMPGMMGGSGSMMPGMMGGSGSMMPGMMGGSGSMMPGMMGMGGGAETTNYATTEAPTIMIRSLDFTAEPDTTYRYRLRIVVFNPNYNREDVSPGTDTKTLELFGDWSEPTNEVTMPADVTAYAMRKLPSPPNAKRADKVSFQIVKWDPDTGVTVTRTLDYGPGEIVGEQVSTQVPVSDGTGAKSKPIDYNSHQFMLDETGGDQSLAAVGVGGKLDVPALTLLMRPDGSVAVRNQAYDAADPVRKDLISNYNREIEESKKGRESSTGMGSSSSMMMMMMSGQR